MDIKDVGDRQKNYGQTIKILERLELGLRAVSVMYDEYSSDKKSNENIFRLKDNIDYRLGSALQHYKLLLQQHDSGEQYLAQQTKDNPFRFQGFIFGNPYFDLIEKELSGLFDSIVFNITSSFDYLSHIICYICQTNKQNTVYWTRLAKASRGQGNDISQSLVKTQIDNVDRSFVAGLYDYRSRLIHNQRDKHNFKDTQNPVSNTHRIRLLISESAKSDFKKIRIDYGNDKEFTITFLSFWLIKTAAENMEIIFDGLVNEIRQKSNYYYNLRGFKGNNKLIMLHLDPATNTGTPLSENFWKEYKNSQL